MLDNNTKDWSIGNAALGKNAKTSHPISDIHVLFGRNKTKVSFKRGKLAETATKTWAQCRCYMVCPFVRTYTHCSVLVFSVLIDPIWTLFQSRLAILIAFSFRFVKSHKTHMLNDTL